MFGFLGLILVIDRFSTLFHRMFDLGGLVYLIAVVFIACWSGFRAGMISVGLFVVYVWLIFHFPFSVYPRDRSKEKETLEFVLILYSLAAIIAASVQERLFTSAVREFDARAAAEAEAKQRRIAEAELWASEDMRQLIVDSSVDAVIGLDEGGVITVWNPNAEKLFGWTREEAIGQAVGDRILLSERNNGPMFGLQRFLHSAQNPVLRSRLELVAKTKQGAEVSIELYLADHRTDQGYVYICFARDISDRKLAELAIQELNARLEDRVVERTLQLESANSELVGFTYSVSHDLRAPLRAIVSNSRILCEESGENLDEESLERLGRLESNALKMSKLIENLLQFARMGQISLNLEEIDLSSMAREIAKDLQTGSEGTIEIQDGLKSKGDPEMIKLVLLNLMENAWKYAKSGEPPSIEVGESSEGVYYVRDRGIGFDMRYVDKIWQPFERLHREEEYPGTGIGLANCKRIVTRHGGEIWAESVPNEGTTIYFRLGPISMDGDPIDTDPGPKARYVS